MFFSPHRVVEQTYEIGHVIAEMRRRGRSPVVEIHQLDFKQDASLPHEYIVRVQVSVIFLHAVDVFKPPRQRVYEMQGLEGHESFAPLAGDKVGQQFAIHQFADEAGDGHSPMSYGFRVKILDDDLAVAEPIELLCVEHHRAITIISMGIKEFGGPADPGLLLHHLIDFALPASAELGFDGVFAADDPSGFQVEGHDVIFLN